MYNIVVFLYHWLCIIINAFTLKKLLSKSKMYLFKVSFTIHFLPERILPENPIGLIWSKKCLHKKTNQIQTFYKKLLKSGE